jgi:hypothetical protein
MNRGEGQVVFTRRYENNKVVKNISTRIKFTCLDEYLKQYSTYLEILLLKYDNLRARLSYCIFARTTISPIPLLHIDIKKLK